MGLPALNEADVELARACLGGNDAAWEALRREHHEFLVNVLKRRGAADAEARDLLTDLWGECFAGAGSRPPLLSSYRGQCSLRTWLVVVATRRLIDAKRSARFRSEVGLPDNPAAAELAAPAPLQDDSLSQLVGTSLRQAFAGIDSSSILLLRLVYLHNVPQRSLARCWNCHESQISRRLDAAMAHVRSEVVAMIRRRDPWLQLEWGDFVDLCRDMKDWI